jgi:hypothetical protein
LTRIYLQTALPSFLSNMAAVLSIPSGGRTNYAIEGNGTHKMVDYVTLLIKWTNRFLLIAPW